MKSVKDIPFRFPEGPIDGRALAQILGVWQREILAEFDIRNAQAFPGAIAANNDGTVTLGRYSQVADQRTLPQISSGNRMSSQSIVPLTSTGQASSATIVIAAHTLQYGFGAVSYGAGSIAGLVNETVYYVYADDPTYAGGAVAYTATTTGTTVTAANGRYYVGAIKTAAAAVAGSVSAATSANPIEITTAANHGWSSGYTVTFATMPGSFAVLNGNNYAVTVTAVNKFTIPVDGSLFAAYTSGGTVTRVVSSTSGGGGGGWDYREGTVIP